MNKITITIEGDKASGKTTIAYIINNFLNKQGIHTNIIYPENSFDYEGSSGDYMISNNYNELKENMNKEVLTYGTYLKWSIECMKRRLEIEIKTKRL